MFEGVRRRPAASALEPLQQEFEDNQLEARASIYGGYSRFSNGLLFAMCGRKRGRTGDQTYTWLGVIDWGTSDLLDFQDSEIGSNCNILSWVNR